jgi:large subunit ribosomal protein L24
VAFHKPQPPVKMKLRKGDRVQVLSGKDRGQTGEVTRVFPETNKVIVEGVNVAKKHQRQTSTRLKGGIIDKDMPVHASAVAIVCSKDGPTRIGYRFDEDGTKRRVCVHCGETI